MPHALFIADLHLCISRPNITQVFLSFMDTAVPQAESLYILGDLFEYWAGDDDLAKPLHLAVVKKFQALRQRNVQIFFMHGNRDFLIAQKFADIAGIALMADPTIVHLYGTDTLLMHGDTLCTDDVDYLKFRAMVRDDQWQATFLAQPLAARHALIQDMRETSESEKSNKPAEIMDASESAVLEAFKKHAVPRIIHGHTHRPACHHYELNGKPYQRWVLPAWYEEGGYLHCDAAGCRMITL